MTSSTNTGQRARLDTGKWLGRLLGVGIGIAIVQVFLFRWPSIENVLVVYFTVFLALELYDRLKARKTQLKPMYVEKGFHNDH
jgi:hypothetical protein